MPPVNVLLSGLPFRPSTICLPVGDKSTTLNGRMVADAVVAATGLPRASFFLRTHNSLLHSSAALTVPGQHTAFVTLCLRRALPGGRGGLGSTVRGGACSRYVGALDCWQEVCSRRDRYVRYEGQVRKDLTRNLDAQISQRIERKRPLENDEKFQHLLNSERHDPLPTFATTAHSRLCRKRPRVTTTSCAGFQRDSDGMANEAMANGHSVNEGEKMHGTQACSAQSKQQGYVNIIVSDLPYQPSTLCLKLGDRSSSLLANTVEAAITEATGLAKGSFLLREGVSILRQSDVVAQAGQHTAFVSLWMRRVLPGGKGGFGAMLRGSGSTKKTTNFDACRDLQGRRLRHIRDERAIREYMSGQGESSATGGETNAPREGVTQEGKRERDVEEEKVDLGKLEDDMDRVSRSVSDAVADALTNVVAARCKRRKVEEVGGHSGMDKGINEASAESGQNGRENGDSIETTEGSDKSSDDTRDTEVHCEVTEANEKDEKDERKDVESSGWMGGYDDVESSDDSDFEDDGKSGGIKECNSEV